MFSAVRIGTGEWDIGCIVEAMIYYGRVNVFVRSGTIVEMVKRLGFEPIMDALDLGVLELDFERNGYAVASNKVGNFERHGLTNVALAGTADGQKISSAADEIEHQFRRHLGNDAENIRKARQLAERVHEVPINKKILTQAESDLKGSNVRR